MWLSEAEYVDLREQQKSFEHFSVYRTGSANLIQDEKEVRINVAAVSEAFFSIPAISALVGRTFLPQEHAEANSDVVVLAYHTWQEDFAGVPEVVGKTVALDGRDLTIVGVMPPGFGFPYGWLDAWIPLAVDNANAESRETHNLLAVARLKPGITVETASSEVGTIALRLQQEHPNAYYFPSFGASVVRLK